MAGPRGRRRFDYFRLETLGFHSLGTANDLLDRRIQRTRDYLIVHRFYGQAYISWEDLSSEFKRIWLVLFDSEFSAILDAWRVQRRNFRSTTFGSLRRTDLKRKLYRRFRLLLWRAYQIVPH